MNDICPFDNCTAIFHLVDRFGDRDGQISLSEWINYVKVYHYGDKDMIARFKLYDTNNDGYLTKEEAFAKPSKSKF